ncbi:MAG: epoxyqueuosine reductase QueH [Lachnospiraceae bacterium]|nr:epoxyqueuosine reductase QueH [Lachnospiraceae bacterium]
MNRNYSKELGNILNDKTTRGKKLLLHSCCAPCSSYCLEYLRPFFAITVFYYNPNISPAAEYMKRKEEQQRLIGQMNRSINQPADRSIVQPVNRLSGEGDAFPIDYLEGDYEPELFAQLSKGREQCREGGERCFHCYRLRLERSAQKAKEGAADYFTTTLTISPLKDASKINAIGEAIATETGVAFLPADFKKREGYKRSIELSKEYGLYRQDFCGCVYSQRG